MNKKMEKLRQEFITLCNELNVEDFIVYCNRKRYLYGTYSRYKNEPTIEDCDVREYLEYCNPKTMSVVSEGTLYDIYNYAFEDRYLQECREKFDELFKKYGLYSELGNSWNFSLYEI